MPQEPPSDVLQKDLEHFGSALLANEELGERRLSFFVGIVTAVLGALGFMGKNDDGFALARVVWPAAFALGGLLLVGALTFLRMIKRNRATDEYRAALRLLREHAYGPNAALLKGLYDSFSSGPGKGGRRPQDGGLAFVIIAINALLTGLLGFVVLRLLKLSVTEWASAAMVCAVFALSVAVQWWAMSRLTQ